MEILRQLHTMRGTSMFDTLRYTKEAVAAGFTQKQAEFQAEKMAELINDSLVTKDYFKQEILHMENRIVRFIHKRSWAIIVGVPAMITLLNQLYKLSME